MTADHAHLAAPAPGQARGRGGAPLGAEVWLSPGRARVHLPPALPLDRLLSGRTPEEAAALLPRLFNLCPMAQEQAARLSLRLAPLPDTGAEVIRLHLSRLFVTLRAALDLRPLPPPPASPALWGGAFPQTRDDLARFLAADLPLAELARALALAFHEGEALTPPLPFPKGREALTDHPFENSPAGRQAHHPLMQALEAAEGRSPFWRLIGLMADLEAARLGALPPDFCEEGIATVQASRGAYALRVTTEGGRITGLTRRTPTDHLMAPGGALEIALSTTRRPLAPLVLALHDPCMAVTIREAENA
ncbi:HupK protein [Stagnihabitans tardus]|uniref:HupK protein n=1 Tax=Stagnihabitans tardus TaxID=2699202 RepID=A0AAE5BST8_9RHOB|nr:HupK protein [Stagnihabitans tardus]NBZ88265.1 HupK protein [Stagnihabitans tardus]